MQLVANVIAAYRVDSTWKTYQPVSIKSDAFVLSLRDTEYTRAQDGIQFDALPGLLLAQPQVESAYIDPKMPSSFPSGYPAPVNMRANGSATFKANVIDDMVGSPVQVTMELDANSSTTLVENYHEWEIDLGTLLADAVVVTTTRFSTSPYTVRAVSLIMGTLKSAVHGLYKIKFGWGLKHSHSPDDQYDNLTLSVRFSIAGISMRSIIREVDAVEASEYRKRLADGCCAACGSELSDCSDTNFDESTHTLDITHSPECRSQCT